MQELTYLDLDSALDRLDVATDVAEVHGSLTAVACFNGVDGYDIWLGSHFPELQTAIEEGDALARETRQTILDLYNQICTQLANDDFTYTLLMPDDDADLELRTEAMAHWCQGFLLGMRYSGVTDFNQFNGELGEIINDISEISQVTAGELDYSEEEEQSYSELQEYLRVGVMLFNETLNSKQANTTSPDVNQSLH